MTYHRDLMTPTPIKTGVEVPGSGESAAAVPSPAGSERPASEAVQGWSEEALAGNPHSDREKAERVRAMFAAIAWRYDLNNRLHAMGQDQLWRRRVVKMAELRPGDRVLDIACGTGDLSEAFAAAGAASVLGVDFTPQMLDLARVKAVRRKYAAALRYETGDAMALDLPDASFDVVSIAFGIRNVTDPAIALREMRRVLRPGGRLLILECSEPRMGLLRWASRIYTHRIMPVTASLIARDSSGAYRYLPRSVETFLEPETLAAEVAAAGFSDVTMRRLSLGVAAIVRGAVAAR